jgi:hypothetical protein
VRRVVAVGAVLSALPTAVALVAVRPATAAVVGYDQVGTTALASGVRTSGTVGASGGLLTLDSGSAGITATLDGSPSAHVVAAPVEPGGLFRTIVGQVNTSAGRKVLGVSDAEARYPSSTTHQELDTVPPTAVGPVTGHGGSATAAASAHRVTGTATGAAYAVAGVMSSQGSTSRVDMSVDAASGRVSQTAATSVARVDVAGVLELSDVEAQARIVADEGMHTAVQTLTIGGARVGGQAVTIGNDGVTAVGTPLLPSQTLSSATAQANAALARSGVVVHTVGGVVQHDGRSASADTGGVLITVTTRSLPGGVAENVLTVVVGGVALTELDAPGTPITGGPGLPPATVSGVPGASTTTTTIVPGTAGIQGMPEAVRPAVATPALPVSYVLGGHRFSGQDALIAFAIWQLLSLSVPTLYALVDRRRRLALAGGVV